MRIWESLTLQSIRAWSLGGKPEVIESSLDGILRALRQRRDDLQRHAAIVVLTRVAMLLLPRLDDSLSYNGMARLTKKYLTELGLEEGEGFDDADVDEIMRVISMIRAAERGQKKTGWSDLYYKDKKQILEQQGGRCGICGRVLVPGADASDPARPEIDHIIPFALAGNVETNKRLICGRCNRVKGSNLTFANSDVVALNYFVKRLGRAEGHETALWVLERDGNRCRRPDCQNTAATSFLTVEQISPLGRYIYDNLRAVCDGCKRGGDTKPVPVRAGE